MTYDNYLAGGSRAYSNTMARPQAQAPATPQMSMAEWQAYLASLTPQQLEELKAQAINWGGGESGGGIDWGKKKKSGEGNPLSGLMGMFGGGSAAP